MWERQRRALLLAFIAIEEYRGQKLPSAAHVLLEEDCEGWMAAALRDIAVFNLRWKARELLEEKLRGGA